MLIKKIIPIMFLLSIIFGCGDGSDDVFFARVNGETITVTEYEQQLADFIRVTGIKDNLQTRLQLLDQLINERLIIDNFRKKKFDQDDDFKRRTENIRSQLLLDEFRKQTFFDTISVAEQEIAQRFSEYNKKVSARHLFARTREEADALYFQLQQGATFEELAKLTFQDSTLAHNGGYLGYFGRGEMDPAFEKAAFSMKVGELSSPVKTGFGYSIIKVEAGFQIPFTSESDFQKLRPNLIREIKRDKAIRYAQQYGKQQAKKLAAEFDSQLVGLIFEKLSKPDVDLNLRKFSDEIKID
ncbi:MAG: peptidylprolyl isomerase, partial [bacterium]|nr:peptidylprolyl isomerase [bacterium]